MFVVGSRSFLPSLSILLQPYFPVAIASAYSAASNSATATDSVIYQTAFTSTPTSARLLPPRQILEWKQDQQSRVLLMLTGGVRCIRDDGVLVGGGRRKGRKGRRGRATRRPLRDARHGFDPGRGAAWSPPNVHSVLHNEVQSSCMYPLPQSQPFA
jgi:hypothetical protein